MSTPDKSFIAVDPESGATYRFNETDWQEKKDRLLERYPKAEIMEYDSYNPEDVQENDSIFVTVGDGAYSFTPSEWQEKQEKLMARYPNAQVNRVRGVNYWEEKATAQEEAIKAKRAEMQAIPQDATELWGNNPDYLRNLNELEELEKAYKANPYAQMKEEQEKSSLRRLKETTEKDYADFMKEYEDVVYGGGGAPMSTLVGSSEDAMMEGFARSVGSAVRGEDLGRQEEFNVQKPLFDAALQNINDAYEILERPDQTERNGNAIVNVFKGIGEVYGSPEFWSRGMNKLVALNNGGNAAIEKINRKLQEPGESLTEEDIDKILTPAEKAYVFSLMEVANAEAQRAPIEGLPDEFNADRKVSKAYQIGQGIAEMTGYVAEFLLTGDITDAATAGATKAVQGWLVKNLMAKGGKTLGRKAARGLSKVAVNALTKTTSALMAAPVRTAAMGGTGGLGGAIAEQRTSLQEDGTFKGSASSVFGGAYDLAVENFTEEMGPAITDLLGAPFKPLVKPVKNWLKTADYDELGKLATLARKAGKIVDGTSPMAKALAKAGYHGSVEEYGEEFLGAVLRGELDEFFDKDQQLVLIGTFAPMSLLGMGGSAAHVIRTTKEVQAAAENMKVNLIKEGVDQKSADYMADYFRKTSAQKMKDEFAPVIGRLQQQSGLGEAFYTSDLYKSIARYIKAVAEYQTIDSQYKEQEAQQRVDKRAELEEKFGKFYNQADNTVNVVQLKDGRLVYQVTDFATNGEAGAVDMKDGAATTFRAEDVQTYTDEEGNSHNQESGKMSLDSYLSSEIMRMKQSAQVARMRADRQKQIDALAKELPKTFDLGTKAEPLNVNVVSHDANGVKVEDANKNEMTLGWEKVGRLLNKPIHVLTDNEIAEAEAADIALRVEAVRSKNAQSPAEEIDVEAEIDATNEEVKSLQQKPEDAYTDKETGLVDEIAFWNNDPEGYCDWNDRQQNDGGIDSMKQIVNAKAAIESVIKKAEKEAKTDNPVTRRTAESIMLSAQEQYDRLSAIEQKYAEQRTSNEEKRAEEVIAMRERISFWRERLNLGDRLVVLESLDEVTNPLAKKAISLGRTEGWYDAKEKKVYLYMPDIATRKVLDKTIMHEVVTHYGLDNLLGEQEYARLTDMVWNIMSDTAKRSFYNYAGVNTISDPVLRRRRAAEEFIALVAEDVSFERANAEKRSIWQRIVDFFSKLFEKDELNLTAKEIAEVLDKNIKGLTVGNEQIVEEFKAEAASVQPEVSKSEADLHTEAVLNESGMSMMEDIEENVTAQAETMTTAAGAPVTSDTNDGTTMLSTATAKPWVDNLGNEHRGTMEMVLERMKEKGFSEQEVKQMEVKMQTAYDYMMKLQSLTNPDGSVRFEEFNAWAEKTPYYKQIGRNFVKAITSLVSNGDYPINLELTTDCIKREAFTMLLNELVKRGADLAGMGPAEIVTIQKMMKQYGIQVACALCFVEGKRLQIVNWASQIVNDWNDALAEAGVETDEMFEFGKDGDAFIPADEWRTYEDKPALAKALRTIDEVAKIFQGVDPKVYKEQKAKNEKALEKYIKEKEEAAAKKGKKWTPTDEQKREMKKIKVEGLTPTYVNENMKEYTAAFEEMRNEWVSKSPKKGPMRDPLAFTPTKAQWSELEKIRNRQIENVKQKMVRLIMEYPEMRKKMTLNDLLGSKGLMEIRQQHGAAYEQLYSIILQRFGTGTPKPVQDAVPYDGEVMTLTESAFKAANKIGGARLFSFSDFDITKVFDYMQMFFDLEANRQMLQSYTKEVAAILLFGKSNAKFNISTLASAVVPAEVMEEYESANDARRRELRHQWAENAGLIVDESGTITGINFSEEHSVSPEFAQQIFHDDSRNKDCGAIMVGASVNHAIFSAAQDWIRMVIPFHLSGMPIAARDKTDVKWWTDNTEYQSTRKRTKDGWSKIDKKEDTFEFYADMHQEGWNMRDKAREYIEWCKSNAFRPKFDWGINSDYYRAYCEENGYTPNQQIIDMMDADTTNGVWNQYYKFLTDFTAFKPVFNEEGEMIDEIPSPQQRVVSNFDMSEMEKQVIFEGENSMLARREGNIALANQHVSELADRVAPYLNGQITEEEMELRDDVFYDARKDANAYLDAKQKEAEGKDVRLKSNASQEAVDSVLGEETTMFKTRRAQKQLPDDLKRKEVEEVYGGIWIGNKQEYAKFVSAVNHYGIEENGRGVVFTDNRTMYQYYWNENGEPIPFRKLYISNEIREKFDSIIDEIHDRGEDATLRDIIRAFNESDENAEGETDRGSDTNTSVPLPFGDGGLGEDILREGAYAQSPELYVTSGRPYDAETFFKTSPRTAEQRTALFEAAKEEFGVTNNFGVAGYMLPDGTLLDFSEAKDGGPANKRTRDHREVGSIIEDRDYDTRSEYITDFLNEGAIRLMPESDAVNLSVAPSAEQREKLLDYFYKKNGYIILEIDDQNGKSAAYMEYDKGTSPYRIMRDIDNYFNEGIVPQQNTMFKTSNRNQAIFVSNAAKAVEGINMGKAAPEQWLKTLEKNGGLKAGEDKWMGLSEWLKSTDKKSVTKQELLDFINENMIQIEEQHYGEIDEEKARGIDTSDVDWWERDSSHDVLEDENGVRAINNTRIGLTTKGLENKREIALTVPTVESWDEDDIVHFGDAGEGRAVAWIRFGETADENGNRVLVIDEIQSNRHQEGRKKGYLTEEKRVNADAEHKRLIKAASDATSNLYDFIGTLVAKYPGTEYDIESARGNLGRFTVEERLKFSELEDARRDREYELRRYKAPTGIPEAPFEKNWHELAMKRMLRYAAENGYDYVAWTKGDQQAERNNIGGVVSEIKATKYPRGYEVVSFGKNGSIVHYEVFADENAMAGVYGKEMSQRIIESVNVLEPSETATISGDDLRVGGEGMRGFYDKMLPAFMNKYGKKWGIHVEDITLPNVEEAGRVMHSVPVTEEMRESVMEGQTMFKTSPHQSSLEEITDMFYAWNQDDSLRPLFRKAYDFCNEIDLDVKFVSEEEMARLEGKGEGEQGARGINWGKKIRLNSDVFANIPDQLKASIILHEMIHAATNYILVQNEERLEYENHREAKRELEAIFEEIKNKFPDQYGSTDVNEMVAEMAKPEFRDVMKQGTWWERFLNAIRRLLGISEKDYDRLTPTLAWVYELMDNPSFELFEEAKPNSEEYTLFKTAITPEVRKEMDVIAAQAMVNGNYLLAPNGKDTKLTPEQWALVRTEDFKEEYGDWENDPENSLVPLDENGEPTENNGEYSEDNEDIRFKTSRQLDQEFGNAWREQQNEDGRHSTQVANTKSTYEKIGRWMKDESLEGVSILDASSGLGLGTQALREMGFQVDDVEPFPSENREAPTFASYDDIDGKYDVVISNAVLNVIPDDWRADVLHKMASVVKDGGKIIINTRPASNISKQGVEGKTRITLDSPSEILVKRGDRIAAYQKGFTSEELAEWIKSELGEGWRVEKATKKNSGISGEGTAVVLKEGEDIRFSTSARDKSIDEIVMEGKQKVSSENTQAVDAFMDRIRRINGNLQQLRMAAAAQREYDQKTVKTITDIANDLLEGGALNDLTRGEIKRLLSIVNGGVGKNDLTKSVDRLMDLMVANQLRYGKSLIEKFLKIRGSKVDQRGVEVRGKLDIPGQQMLAAFKDGIGVSKDALANKIAEAEDALDSDSETKRRNAENELVGLYLALQYQEDINDSVEEEKSLRDEIKKADEDYEAGIITKQMHRQLLGTIYEAILENRIQRVNAYEKLASDLGTKLVSSIKNAGILRDAEKERIQKIQHYANSDMKGMPADMHEVKESKFWNRSLVRFLLKPLATFDQMLRAFAPKSTSGEGYLWNHFMGGWLRATENEYKGVQKVHETLDEAARSMFGEGVQKWSDLFEKERKMPKLTIAVWDDNKMVEKEISQGNALYIYMVNKMTDGKMKLRKMGISQEDVDAIVAQMDRRFIALADWMQEQFLPSIRDKYNAVHERLFGAPMASIDNYFPIKVNARARTRDVDVEAGEGTAKPATITGSIIKRTRNSLALDIMNADAFDVMLEHIQQMEHWAAFAEFNKDLNTLLSYRKFRNRVENMSGIYGSGKTVWNNFKTVAEIAAGVYQPASKSDSLDKAAMNLAKGVTGAKIAFRVYTAIKQLLSMPAFVSDANILSLGKNMAKPWAAWNWAMENLPMFEKRWKSRQAGDTRLMATESDWGLWKTRIVEIASRYGMTPNAFIDAVTVSIGAKSIYETKYKEYLKMGYSEEQADKKAKRDATVLFNESQQSNESAFLSAVQIDRTVASVAFTVFRNSAMGYQRMAVDALRNLSQMTQKGYKEEAIEYIKKQMVRDGLTEEKAERAAQRIYSRSFAKSAARLATFSFLVQFAWNLGAYLPYLLVGDDDDEKKAMIKDAAVRGLVGGTIEGLAGGNIVSNMAGNLAMGEKLSEASTTLLPVVSDIEKVIKMLDYDKVAAYNEIFNLVVQSVIGVNPQTVTDIIVGIDDACNGDPETSKEVALCIMRMLQVPQSQIEKVYMDEIDFTVDKGLDLTIEQLAKRYADYKVNRGAPLTGWMYEDAVEKEREDKYIKRFLKTAEELKRSRGNEEAKKYYEYLDTDYKEVTETISELRRNAEAAAMKGDQMGAMEYASMLNDFMKTDIFKEYTKFGGKAKAIEAIRDKMKKVDMQTREALEDMMLQLRKEMVEEMEQAKAETDAND